MFPRAVTRPAPSGAVPGGRGCHKARVKEGFERGGKRAGLTRGERRDGGDFTSGFSAESGFNGDFKRVAGLARAAGAAWQRRSEERVVYARWASVAREKLFWFFSAHEVFRRRARNPGINRKNRETSLSCTCLGRKIVCWLVSSIPRFHSRGFPHTVLCARFGLLGQNRVPWHWARALGPRFSEVHGWYVERRND